jgi:glutaredoxin 3
MPPVTLYSTRHCGYCTRVKALLETRQIPYVEVLVDQEPEKRIEMVQRSGRRSVPQVFIGDRHLGGYDELNMLARDGILAKLLAGTPA